MDIGEKNGETFASFCMYVCVYICVCVYIYVSVCMHAYVHVFVCVYASGISIGVTCPLRLGGMRQLNYRQT